MLLLLLLLLLRRRWLRRCRALRWGHCRWPASPCGVISSRPLRRGTLRMGEGGRGGRRVAGVGASGSARAQRGFFPADGAAAHFSLRYCMCVLDGWARERWGGGRRVLAKARAGGLGCAPLRTARSTRQVAREVLWWAGGESGVLAAAGGRPSAKVAAALEGVGLAREVVCGAVAEHAERARRGRGRIEHGSRHGGRRERGPSGHGGRRTEKERELPVKATFLQKGTPRIRLFTMRLFEARVWGEITHRRSSLMIYDELLVRDDAAQANLCCGALSQLISGLLRVAPSVSAFCPPPTCVRCGYGCTLCVI